MREPFCQAGPPDGSHKVKERSPGQGCGRTAVSSGGRAGALEKWGRCLVENTTPSPSRRTQNLRSTPGSWWEGRRDLLYKQRLESVYRGLW